MRGITRGLAGLGLASLVLLGAPAISQAQVIDGQDLSYEAQADTSVQTVSTYGDPAHARLLNAGTEYWLQVQPAGGAEVAGAQAGLVGPGVQTVSTTGTPAFASMLNAGTEYTVQFLGQR